MQKRCLRHRHSKALRATFSAGSPTATAPPLARERCRSHFGVAIGASRQDGPRLKNALGGGGFGRRGSRHRDRCAASDRSAGLSTSRGSWASSCCDSRFRSRGGPHLAREVSRSAAAGSVKDRRSRCHLFRCCFAISADVLVQRRFARAERCRLRERCLAIGPAAAVGAGGGGDDITAFIRIGSLSVGFEYGLVDRVIDACCPTNVTALPPVFRRQPLSWPCVPLTPGPWRRRAARPLFPTFEVRRR